MTDRTKLINEINEAIDHREWDKSADYEVLRTIFEYVSAPEYDWRRLDEAFGGRSEIYYVTTYYSKKLQKTVIFNEDDWACWDSVEEFADWIIDTNKKIREFENKIPEGSSK